MSVAEAAAPRRGVRAAAASAVFVACIVAVPGIAAIATGKLLLFPSLGPSAVMQAHRPEHPSSRAPTVIVAHLVGLASALLMTWLFGLAHAPSVFQVHAISGARAGATVCAIAMGTFLEIVLRSSHPPSASTTLLVSLGSFKPTVRDVSAVVIGVLIVAVAGEIGRRIRLRSDADGAA